MDVKNSDHKITSKPDVLEMFLDAKHRENGQHIGYNSHPARFNSVLKSYTTLLVKQEYVPESECEEVFEMTIDVEDIKKEPLDDKNFEVAQDFPRKCHTEGLLLDDRTKKEEEIVPGYPGILFVRPPAKRRLSDSEENSYKKQFPLLQTTETTGTPSILEKEQCLAIYRGDTGSALLGIKSNSISYSSDKQLSLDSAVQGENNFSGQMTTVNNSKATMKFAVNNSKMSCQIAKVIPYDEISNRAENNIQKKRSAKPYLHKESKNFKQDTLEICNPKQLEVDNGKHNHLLDDEAQMPSSAEISGPNMLSVPPKMKSLAESKVNNIEQLQLPSKGQSLLSIETGDSDKEISELEQENTLFEKALDFAAQGRNNFFGKMATVKDSKTSVRCEVNDSKVSFSEMTKVIPCDETNNGTENNIKKKRSAKPSLRKESKRSIRSTFENCYPKQLEVDNGKNNILFDDKAQMRNSAEISGPNKLSVPPKMKSLAESRAENIEQLYPPSKGQSLSSVETGDSDKETSQLEQKNNLCQKTLDFSAQGKNDFYGQMAVKDSKTSVKVSSPEMAKVVSRVKISNGGENNIQKMRSAEPSLHEESKRFKKSTFGNCYPKQLEVGCKTNSFHLFHDEAEMPSSAEISGPNMLSVPPKMKSLAESKANNIEQLQLPSKGQSLSSIEIGDSDIEISQLEQENTLFEKALDFAVQGKNNFFGQMATVKDSKISMRCEANDSKASSSEMAKVVPCDERNNETENNIQKKRSAKPSLHEESKRFKKSTLGNCYPKQLEVDHKTNNFHLFDDKAQMPNSAQISEPNKLSVSPKRKILAESKANNIAQLYLSSKGQSLSTVETGDSDKETSQLEQKNNLCGKTLDFAAQGKNNFYVKDSKTSVKVTSPEMPKVVSRDEIGNGGENNIQKMRSAEPSLHEESKRFKKSTLGNCHPKQLEVDRKTNDFHLFDDKAQMPNSAEISGLNKLNVPPEMSGLAETKANNIEQFQLLSKGQSLSPVEICDSDKEISQLEQENSLCGRTLDSAAQGENNFSGQIATVKENKTSMRCEVNDSTASSPEMAKVVLCDERNNETENNIQKKRSAESSLQKESKMLKRSTLEDCYPKPLVVNHEKNNHLFEDKAQAPNSAEILGPNKFIVPPKMKSLAESVGNNIEQLQLPSRRQSLSSVKTGDSDKEISQLEQESDLYLKLIDDEERLSTPNIGNSKACVEKDRLPHELVQADYMQSVAKDDVQITFLEREHLSNEANGTERQNLYTNNISGYSVPSHSYHTCDSGSYSQTSLNDWRFNECYDFKKKPSSHVLHNSRYQENAQKKWQTVFPNNKHHTASDHTNPLKSNQNCNYNYNSTSESSVSYHDYPACASKSHSRISRNVDWRFSQCHKGQYHQNEAPNIYYQETTKSSVGMLNNDDVQQSDFSYNNHRMQSNLTHPPVPNRDCFNSPFRPVHNFKNFHSNRMPLPQSFRIPFLPNRFPHLPYGPAYPPRHYGPAYPPRHYGPAYPQRHYGPAYPPRHVFSMSQQTNSFSSYQRC